jgi:hypothetical protein
MKRGVSVLAAILLGAAVGSATIAQSAEWAQGGSGYGGPAVQYNESKHHGGTRLIGPPVRRHHKSGGTGLIGPPIQGRNSGETELIGPPVHGKKSSGTRPSPVEGNGFGGTGG